VITSSTIYFIEAGNTSAQVRLIIISPTPVAIKRRRGFRMLIMSGISKRMRVAERFVSFRLIGG